MFYATGHAGPNEFAIFFESLQIERSKKLAAVSKYLDCTPRTLKRYLTGEICPPRAAVAALFLESPYGVSAIDADQFTELRIINGLLRSTRDENQKLRQALEKLNNELLALKQNTANDQNFAVNDSFFSTPPPHHTATR